MERESEEEGEVEGRGLKEAGRNVTLACCP